MKDLSIWGQTSLCGISIPNIYGGFGEDRKAMLAKTIAELHGREVKEVNRLVNNNRSRFVDGVHVLDLKNKAEFEVLLNHHEIMSQNAINRSENIYLLSERGYVRLLKIMDDDTAWEKWDIIESEYFGLKEARETRSTPIPGGLWTEYLMDVLEHNLSTARKFGELTGMNVNAAYLTALTQTEQQTGEDLSAYKAMVNKASLVNPSQQTRKPGNRLFSGAAKQVQELTQKKAYSAEEARAIVGLGRNKFMDLLHSGQIKGIKAGAKWLVPAWAIDEFLAGK